MKKASPTFLNKIIKGVDHIVVLKNSSLLPGILLVLLLFALV